MTKSALLRRRGTKVSSTSSPSPLSWTGSHHGEFRILSVMVGLVLIVTVLGVPSRYLVQRLFLTNDTTTSTAIDATSITSTTAMWGGGGGGGDSKTE